MNLSFRFYAASITTKMPVKNLSNTKRKVDSSPAVPLVKDPFTAAAAKKKKKEDLNSSDVEIIKPETDQEVNNLNSHANGKTEINLEVDSKEETEPKQSEKEATAQSNGKSNKKVAAIFSKSKKTNKNEKDDENGDEEEDAVVEKEGKNGKESKYNYSKEEFSKPSNGKDWNLKIVSWNVNGIRAWCEKGGIEYLQAEDPDIFCCQETKCEKSKIPVKVESKGYHTYWLSGEKAGYSGVGLMSKVKPIKVSYGINEKKHDNEGRVIVAEYEKFYLVNTYIPNSSRGLVRLPYRMEWEKSMRKFLETLNKSKPIIWCGDLNVAHQEIDIKNPKQNTKTAGFTKEERECFTDLLSDGYIDSFRHLYPDLPDQYTYWSNFSNARERNIGWRLDYFVMADKLKENLADSMIRPKVKGSDHCPIALFLKI